MNQNPLQPNNTNKTLAIATALLAVVFVIGIICVYIFLIYTAVLALKHTDATVNVLGGILIAILINGIGNASNITKGGTIRNR